MMHASVSRRKSALIEKEHEIRMGLLLERTHHGSVIIALDQAFVDRNNNVTSRSGILSADIGTNSLPGIIDPSRKVSKLMCLQLFMSPNEVQLEERLTLSEL